ncbi:MAG: hypothetical protein JXR59_04475 [Desulfuromonadaceae bacterium]|nr:hypothetical protein [Desulfuromonadaceae bacterium]
MSTLLETERSFVESLAGLNLDELDYDLVVKRKSKTTIVLIGIGTILLLIALLFFVVELMPSLIGIGSTPVIGLFILSFGFFFQAVRQQRDLEIRATFEILDHIKAIEGKDGILWRISNTVNAYCDEKYGGVPDQILQLLTSSQIGGIELNDIRLYHELLKQIIAWHKERPEKA